LGNKVLFATHVIKLGFACTELLSAGATHAVRMQLGFAPIVYPPRQYK
jgi:hypothetical protein